MDRAEGRGRFAGRLALGLAVAYVLLWGAIGVLQYRTFNLHVWDVGANFVLTNLSAPPGLDYGHLTWAPQNLVYLLFIPLVKALPSPLTLVLAEDVLMGVGGYAIFRVALERWRRPGAAVLVEGLYLFNYALFGAPFFPNHYEILFSVFFPIAFYFHLKERHSLTAVFLLLAAACSTLGAVESGLFLVVEYGPAFVRALRSRGAALGEFLRAHQPYVAAAVGTVALFVFPFATVGVATTLSYGHFAGGGTPNVAGGILTQLPSKLLYVFLLLLALVPAVFRSRYFLVAVPYLVLTVVAGSTHYADFAYQYSYTVGAILFVAFIAALAPRFREARPAPDPAPAAASAPRALGRSVYRRVRAHPELTQAVVVVLAFGFIALPYSPGNALAGSYGSLPFEDYQLPTLVEYTAYDAALWQMVDRIPASATVLLQENMPMLTSRSVWYEPGSYDGEPVGYALADPSVEWFTYTPPSFIGPYPTPMLTWVNELYENRSYGIVQEYQGAILLQRGYTGAPVGFVPERIHRTGSEFRGANSSSVTYLPTGAVRITDPEMLHFPLYDLTPFVIPPGSYALSFSLAATGAQGSNQLVYGLWTGTAYPSALETRTLNGTEFPSSGAVENFTLDFTVPGYVEAVHFGLYVVDWSGTLELTSASLVQTGVA